MREESLSKIAFLRYNQSHRFSQLGDLPQRLSLNYKSNLVKQANTKDGSAPHESLIVGQPASPDRCIA